MTQSGPLPDVDALNPSDSPDGRALRRGTRRRFLGKYRGTVMQNEDPLDQGRLLVEIAGVTGIPPASWAMPCVPMADLACGIFPRPPIGAGVWVEFEQGDIDHPIWVGGYWSSTRVLPLAAQAVVAALPTDPVITIETRTGGISIADTPLAALGTLCVRSGASSIVFTSAGIQITAPSVSIQTPSFAVNGVALRVTGP